MPRGYEPVVLTEVSKTVPLRVASKEMSKVLQSLHYPDEAVPAVVEMFNSNAKQFVTLGYMFPDGGETRHVEGKKYGKKVLDAWVMTFEGKGLRLIPNKPLEFGGEGCITDYRKLMSALTKWSYTVIAAYTKLGMPLRSVKVELGMKHFDHQEPVLDVMNVQSGEHGLFIYDTGRYLSDDFAGYLMCNPRLDEGVPGAFAVTDYILGD